MSEFRIVSEDGRWVVHTAADPAAAPGVSYTVELPGPVEGWSDGAPPPGMRMAVPLARAAEPIAAGEAVMFGSDALPRLELVGALRRAAQDVVVEESDVAATREAVALRHQVLLEDLADRLDPAVDRPIPTVPIRRP